MRTLAKLLAARASTGAVVCIDLFCHVACLQLFQSTFIKILYPGATILTTLEWTLLNSAVSLVLLL